MYHRGAVLSAAVAAASVRALSLLLLFIDLFVCFNTRWVGLGAGGRGGTLWLGSIIRIFQEKFSIQSGSPMGISPLHKEKQPPNSPHPTCFVLPWNTFTKRLENKGERGGRVGGLGSGQPLTFPSSGLWASYRLAIQSMRLILCCCHRHSHRRHPAPTVSPSSRCSRWAARGSRSLRSRRPDSRSSGRQKQVSGSISQISHIQCLCVILSGMDGYGR